MTGLPSGVFLDVLGKKKEREITPMYELVEHSGAAFTRGLAVPARPAEAVDFLSKIAACRKAKKYQDRVYREMAQMFLKEIAQIQSQSVPLMAKWFMEMTLPAADVDPESFVHCARVLQALFELSPNVARDVVGGSLTSDRWPEFLLVYHLMPNCHVMTNCSWRPQEKASLPRLFGGAHAPLPSVLEQVVESVYESYLAGHEQRPTLRQLVEAVAKGIREMDTTHLSEAKKMVQPRWTDVKNAVVRLNRNYAKDILLSDMAYGYSTERLRGLREQRGLRRNQLAKRVGVVPSCISNYESGKQAPPTATLEKIAEALDANILYLMGSKNVGVFVPRFDRARFRLARDARGYTRERLAQEAGISEFTIRNWEIGVKAPTADEKPALEKAAQILGVTYDYFVGLENLKVVIPTFDPSRLKRARLGEGWSIRKASRETAVDMGALKKLEDGKRKPRRKILEKIAAVYGVTYDYFMGVEDLDIKLPKFQPVRLKIARLKQALTMGELALAMEDFTLKSSIADWEMGRHKPSRKNLASLAECLKVSREYLLGMAEGDDDVPQFIPLCLQIARKHRGLSQDELGSLVGKRRHEILDWEQGRVAPSVMSVRRLAKALDVPYGYLMGFEDLPIIHPAFDRERFAHALARRHRTMMELMEVTGISAVELKAIQQGEIQPGSRVVWKLERAIHVPAGYCLGMGEKELTPMLCPARVKMAMAFHQMVDKDVASAMGISVRQFNRWMRQEKFPAPAELDQMARALFVSRGFLLGEETIEGSRLLAISRFAGAVPAGFTPTTGFALRKPASGLGPDTDARISTSL